MKSKLELEIKKIGPDCSGPHDNFNYNFKFHHHPHK